MALTASPQPEPQAAPAWAAALAALAKQALPVWLERQGEAWAIKEMVSGRYVQAAPSLAQLWGRPLEELLGHSDAELFGAPLAATWRAAEQTASAQPDGLWSEHRLDVAGTRRDFQVLRLVHELAGQRWLLALWRDAAPQAQHEAQLRHALEQIEQVQRANELLRRELADQALRDPSSGLYTRAHFEDQLRREVDLSTREHREFAIVFIALDPPQGKALEAGVAGLAQVLDAIGRLLRGGTRAMDASCRLDDERFAVLLSGVGLATAHARMEGLRRRCASQIVVSHGQELGFTVAMGVASFPHTAQTQDELHMACEAALAEARRRGGNQVTLAAIPFERG